MYKIVDVAGTGKFKKLAEYALENDCYMLVPEKKLERYINRIIGYNINPNIIKGFTEEQIKECYRTGKNFVIYDMENSLRSLLGNGFVGYAYKIDLED